MGHPRKIRSKYSGPSHPWKADRLEKEKILVEKFGLKNKTELWKAEAKLKRMKATAKLATARRDAQSFIEEKQLLERAVRMGILNPGAGLLDLLSLESESILARRLQTVVSNLGLARTVKQARQFIVHNHILVSGKVVSIPSYIVKKEEEGKIIFSEKSALASIEHPERTIKKEEVHAMPVKAQEVKPEAPQVKPEENKKEDKPKKASKTKESKEEPKK